MSRRQRPPPPPPDAVAAFRAVAPRVEGCLDCEDVACLFHALQLAVTTSDAMTDAFARAVPQAVEGERVPGLEQVLLAVRDLVRANAEALGEQDDVPGAVLQGLALQVDALVRGVLR